MNLIALEEKVSRIEKELEVLTRETDKDLFDLRMKVDQLRIENVALKSFFSAATPSFQEQFPEVLASTIQEFDPEAI